MEPPASRAPRVVPYYSAWTDIHSSIHVHSSIFEQEVACWRACHHTTEEGFGKEDTIDKGKIRCQGEPC
jgi:hypothetical protein